MMHFYSGQRFIQVELTIFDLLDCSMTVTGSGEWHGEKEDVRMGVEEGEYMGDIGKLGEAGREWLLTCEFGIWISRQSPLTDAAGSWKPNVKKRAQMERDRYMRANATWRCDTCSLSGL